MKVRTTHEMDEERARTLYIRLPHSIKNSDEIRELLVGDITIKLPRQKSRHCRVVFSSVGEKFKNYKALRKKIIDNKPIIVSNWKPSKAKKFQEKKKDINKKKLKSDIVQKPSPENKVTRICMITNIPVDAKAAQIMKLFPDAKTLCFLPRLYKSSEVKWALIKFKDCVTAGKYLNKEIELPKFRDIELNIVRDTRKQKKKKSLKIYDGDKNENATQKVKNEAVKSEVKEANENEEDGSEAESEEDEGDEDVEEEEEEAEEGSDEGNEETSSEE